MQYQYIETPRLRLRKLTPEVTRHIFTTMDDKTLMDFLGLADFETLEKEKEKFRNGLQMFNKSFVNFQLLDKDSDKVIGGCGFHTWFPLHRRAELGYGIFYDNYKQQGLMTEALKAVLVYGFTEINLHRVEALTASYNTASISTLKKFDFTFEGTLREHYNVEGVMEDSVMFALLKHEYVI